MFLNRVKNDRDAGRFEARGEQIMMMEHLADRRRWEEEMSHDMDSVVGEFEVDVEEDGDGDEVMIPGMFFGRCDLGVVANEDYYR